MPARVVVLCGPSGCGKTWLGRRSKLPVLALDHFFHDGDAPGLPRTPEGTVDWNSPGSWRPDAALEAIERLCTTGSADVPVYDMSVDRTVETRKLHLGGARIFLAEGVFAGELIAGARRRGVLADAMVLRRSPVATLLRRTVRDLRERRKPPMVVLRRTVVLWRRERQLIRTLIGQGARSVGMREAQRRLAGLNV